MMQVMEGRSPSAAKPMADDLKRRAHELLKQAIELDEPQRASFVRENARGNAELYKKVMALLGAVDRSQDFLEAPALASRPNGDKFLKTVKPPTPTDAPVPDAVGNYLVVGVLGVGGMATVYEAIQDKPQRRVALKVMNRSMGRTDAYVRFLFETETLARLQHPGIAQIYEAGAAPLGPDGPAPFFAMELIPDAVPITVYAKRRAMPLREVIAMFASVCDAIHHGHQHGVIHRDVKPGNVLVDREGRPKVIDFGIARTTESSTEPLTARTDLRQIVGTLNYMSPEQCKAGREIDIRTDVYSLGVLLYELVCGQLPHDLSNMPLPAALQAILNEPPRRPQLPPSRMSRDLEAIMLKALEKKPNRRYDSASALATDLRHWLNDQAIEARPPGVLDQCRLFARRNRALVAVGLSIVASAILLASISTVFVVRLTEEVNRRRAAEAQSMHERDVALWQAYTAQIAGAISAMKTGDYRQMRSRLAEVTHPKRGWEWKFLTRVSEQSARAITAHEDMIRDLAVNRDGTRLTTAAYDGSIRLWNAEDLSLLASFSSETGVRSHTVTFTRDGRHIVTGDHDGVVRLLDANDLRLIDVVGHLPAPIQRVVSLPDDRIAAAASDGAALVWTLNPHAESPTPIDQSGGVHGVELAPDGTLFATYNDEGHIWVRRTDDFSVVHRMRFPGAVNQVRFSSDGSILGAVGAVNRLYLWSVVDGRLLREIEVTGGVNTVRSLGFSNDGTMVAAGLIHRDIVVCSVTDGRILGRFGGHTEAVSGLHFKPGDELLVSSSWDRTLRTWRTSEFVSPAGTTTLAHPDRAREAVFSPDGSILAAVSIDGTITLWDPDLAQPIARIRHQATPMHSIAFSPNGELIAAGCGDGVVRVWSAMNGQLLHELPGHEMWIATIAFDPTGTRIAAGSEDRTARVWNLQSGEQELVLEGHRDRINSISFSPDGSTLATGSRDRTVRLWDAITGGERAHLTDHESDVFAVLFSRDGQRLYSGSRDQSVRIWDVESGSALHTLAGHGQSITSLALNPDSSRLAAGSWYGEIVLFDVETLDLIASVRAHESAIRSVMFSPDGRWLASASFDHTVRLLDSATREESDAAHERARHAFAAAKERVRPALARSSGSLAEVVDELANDGGDPEMDYSWVRKAVLSEIVGSTTP